MPVRRHRSNLARLDSTETASPCSSGNTTRESPQALLTLPEAVDPDAAVQPYGMYTASPRSKGAGWSISQSGP